MAFCPFQVGFYEQLQGDISCDRKCALYTEQDKCAILAVAESLNKLVEEKAKEYADNEDD